MKITFHGAAGTVTGSMHLVEAAGKRILLDCGMFQGRRSEADAKNRHLPVDAKAIDAVILSHAHIDHSGSLPTLVKQGFEGPIYATPATIDLCAWMLRDTGHIQESDAEFLNRRRERRRAKGGDADIVEPIYTIADAERTLPHFHPVGYHRHHEIAPGLTFESVDAGHILGSSSIVLTDSTGPKLTRLGFSGDVGRRGLPIVRDPETLPPCDVLILESTYGGKIHRDLGAAADKLADIINRTARRGGRIIVPAFAVGRTQQLVLLLHQLVTGKRIPNIPIFVDSPLAINVTAVHRAHPECFDEETRAYLDRDEDPFGFQRLQYTRDAEESKRLNSLHGPFVVISASGMCEQGRILHHLRNNIEDPRNTVLITGFQAEHTLGRKLVNKLPEVQIFGEPMRLRAEVQSLDSLSGHADQAGLIEWTRPLVPALRQVFLVHGEPKQSAALTQKLREELGVNVQPAPPGLSFDL